MITFHVARQIAETKISEFQTLGDISLIVIDEQIIEKDYAWIFPYTSKKYWETNDMNFAIGGNGPLFISKLDGRISNYRTGLSIQEMIDEYEEQNKIWNLALTDNIFSDTNKVLAFRKILGITIPELASLKNRLTFANGSKTRLLEIQKQLSFVGIGTSLAQRVLTDSTT